MRYPDHGFPDSLDTPGPGTPAAPGNSNRPTETSGTDDRTDTGAFPVLARPGVATPAIARPSMAPADAAPGPTYEDWVAYAADLVNAECSARAGSRGGAGLYAATGDPGYAAYPVPPRPRRAGGDRWIIAVGTVVGVVAAFVAFTAGSPPSHAMPSPFAQSSQAQSSQAQSSQAQSDQPQSSQAPGPALAHRAQATSARPAASLARPAAVAPAPGATRRPASGKTSGFQ